jgi:phosphoglycerate dehydrogenase-like enzyme
MLLQSTQSLVSTTLTRSSNLLTLSVLMAVARNVGDAAQSIKAGKWERSRLVGVEAKGKTLAIVGLGKGNSIDLSLDYG